MQFSDLEQICPKVQSVPKLFCLKNRPLVPRGDSSPCDGKVERMKAQLCRLGPNQAKRRTLWVLEILSRFRTEAKSDASAEKSRRRVFCPT